MVLKTIEGNVVRLAHKKSNGKFKEITVNTDAQSRSFIKKNAESIKYDSTNNVLRFRQGEESRSLASILANEVYGNDIYRITFKDGNKFNLTRKNLI